MGGTGHKGGGAEFAYLSKSHGVDLRENHSPKVAAKAGNNLRAELSSENHGAEAGKRNDEHIDAVPHYVINIGKIDALVNYVAHKRRQKKVTGSCHGKENKRKYYLFLVWQQFFKYSFHFVLKTLFIATEEQNSV